MNNHPAYPNHPMPNHPQGFNHMTHGVPISIHGDGVATIGTGKKWARMCEVVSWPSGLALGLVSHMKMFLIVSIAQMLLVSRGVDSTMDYIWRVFVILCIGYI